MDNYTYSKRYAELYDEIERISERIHDAFVMDRSFDKHEAHGVRRRALDPEIVHNYVNALHEASEELRFLRKFHAFRLTR